jgi:6-phosphogluconolactonase
VNEVSEFLGAKSGGVTSFEVEKPGGQLTQINQQPSGGLGPCYVSTSADGETVFAANYGSGSVASLAADENGRLSPPVSVIQHQGSSINKERQAGPHAHFINLSLDDRFALAVDLGLDKILTYRFDPAAHTLTPADPPSSGIKPGAGPRHLAFHPSGNFVFVDNELENSVGVYQYDKAKGSLTEVELKSTVPAGFSEQSYPAEVMVSATGDYLYVTNRGHDSVAIFKIDQNTGRLTSIGFEPTGGKNPRGAVIDPSGRFMLVANMDSNNIAVFQIDAESGKLKNVQMVQSPDCPGAPSSFAFLMGRPGD